MENRLEDWDKGSTKTQSEDQQTNEPQNNEPEDVLADQTPAQPIGNKEHVMRVLTLAGTVVVWIPFLFTIGTSLMVTTNQGQFLFDYLMPAELFPISLIGSLMLVAAAQMARYLRKTIGFSLVVSTVILFGGQIFAVQSGLAFGATEATGWVWGVILNTIVGYTLAQILIGVAAIKLTKRVFKRD